MEQRFAWVFPLLFVCAALHVTEEFFLPGGFLVWANDAFGAGAMTPDLGVAVNAVFLALMLAAALVGPRSLVFSLATATIVIINGTVHLVGTIVTASYSPSVVTGTLLYLPGHLGVRIRSPFGPPRARGRPPCDRARGCVSRRADRDPCDPASRALVGIPQGCPACPPSVTLCPLERPGPPLSARSG